MAGFFATAARLVRFAGAFFFATVFFAARFVVVFFTLALGDMASLPFGEIVTNIAHYLFARVLSTYFGGERIPPTKYCFTVVTRRTRKGSHHTG